jgi:hypothetical protein
MLIDEEEALTIPKAAQRIAPDLGLSTTTVGAYLREAIARGELTAYKRGDKDRQYLRSIDVDEYKKRQQQFTPLFPVDNDT